MKKEVLRSCIVTNNKLPKEKMIRIAKLKTGEVVIDEKQEFEGRGCYFELNDQNLDEVIKKRLINRSFRTQVDKEVYEKLGELKHGE